MCDPFVIDYHLDHMSRLEAKVERLEAQLAAKDRELVTLTRTEAKAAAKFKGQIENLQQERDKFQRMVIGNQERLNQVLMEKKKESRSGMEIMNLLQDVFHLPFHMAKDQIEESLRTKMASIKERMVELQDAQKGAAVTSEANERELELEAQLVEARSIIQEQLHLTRNMSPFNFICSLCQAGQLSKLMIRSIPAIPTIRVRAVGIGISSAADHEVLAIFSI
ncbi:Afadin/alpha-actinin-binding protein [Thalictrum thalictroides]|uniref:Afadin/alpha-actinin-binding protein n=1 Tax=Thalictrum thalictroides TaxID=46969 RepID=A0A7J6VRQ3_THATH|nr:Afadin/alpha-actinin-binding protein [Thalictrum thalictroides]